MYLVVGQKNKAASRLLPAPESHFMRLSCLLSLLEALLFCAAAGRGGSGTSSIAGEYRNETARSFPRVSSRIYFGYGVE